MKWLLRAAAVGLVAWLVWMGWQRFFVTDQTRIKRLISTMANAVEKNRPLILADCIDGDYSDDRSFDKATLIGVIRFTRLRYDAMFIYISNMTIEIDDDHQKAQAILVAKVLTKRAGGGETEINAERVRLFFRKIDTDWKMIRIESPELKFE